MLSIYPVLLVIALLLVALFAASEAALAATNRVRLRHLLRNQSEENAATTPSDLSRDAQSFIATVTIAANIPLVIAACLALLLGLEFFDELGATILSGGVALLTVALFQVTPRLLVSAPGALEKLWWLQPARLLVAILRPLVGVLLWVGRLILAPLGLLDAPRATDAATGDEEIRDLVEAAGAKGALSESRELIESIFTFGDTRVHEVMIPRPDIIALPLEANAARIMQILEETGASRLPLYEESIDRVVGILHVKDVLAQLKDGQIDFDPRAMLREPLYVPETQKIEAALAAMRAQKTHLAIVIDEFGGTAGLLTVEDILEELVGEIADEHDRRDESLAILDAHTALADARLHSSELEEAWGLALPFDEFDTIGGIMIEKLGRELKVGDTLELPGATLTVYSTRGRRPHKIHIVRREEPESEQTA